MSKGFGYAMLETVLARFERALHSAGAPAVTRLRPGLSEVEAGRLEDRGPDLVTLYRWHDGVEPAEEILRPSEETELCYAMPGLYLDGLWWMPTRLAIQRHALHRMSNEEWLLMDGRHEHVTYTRTGEVIAWCLEDNLQTRFPTLVSFFDLAAAAWEEGIFTWQVAIEEDFGGLFECDRPRLEALIAARPEILRHTIR